MSTTPGAFGRFSVPPLDNTLGAMLIGVLACHTLDFPQPIQRYMASSNKCTPLSQSPVSSIYQGESSGFRFFALISHAVYTYLITWYNDPLNLLRIVWSVLALKSKLLYQYNLTGSSIRSNKAVNALIVQGFFTWRVWHCGADSCIILYGNSNVGHMSYDHVLRLTSSAGRDVARYVKQASSLITLIF
ncbi:hypothetical protein CERSUDRAFT_121902 [Gelatoporia subvermispora B]|uniref:Uncharacterized protein n=1 Tax=Ceriporiopsis subvermispora (strain B) TaxID=914234 RepID=M2R534_CERS8|nr:hypothetical protein CERSUDRAFT_121902 [Gelatoporia subvermispora B]